MAQPKLRENVCNLKKWGFFGLELPGNESKKGSTVSDYLRQKRDDF